MNPDPSPLATTARTAVVGVAVAFGVLLLPAIVCGLLAGWLARRQQLRYTWTFPLLALGLLPLAIAPGAVLGRLRHLADEVLHRSISVMDVIGAGWALWPAALALSALAYMLWIGRRDLLHGGERERIAAGALGPLQTYRLHRARRMAAAEGIRTPDGTLLGYDRHRAPVRIPPLVAHGMIVGGSNSGKTNTAEVVLEGSVAAGGGFIVADGKGGRDLPNTALALGAKYQRPVAFWSLLPYGDPALDDLRLPWNPAGGGNATEIKDRIASSEEQENPYYKSVASYGLLAAAKALQDQFGQCSLDLLGKLLDNPDTLREHLQTATNPAQYQGAIDWLENVTEEELSGMRGMGLRLRTMVESDGGMWMLPDDHGHEIDLYRAIRDGWLVVFSLPQGSYPELIPHLTRYVVSAVNAVAGRLEREGLTVDCTLFIDELSAFDGQQLASTLERGRSAGIRCLMATQSLSNFADAGGDKLLHAAIDNSELIVVHRQAVPDAADLFASVGGTEEALEHTHKIDDAHSLHIGLDEVGERARRLTDRFRAHPNDIKQLGRGQAIVIAQRPAFAVHHLNVSPGATARRKDDELTGPTRTDQQISQALRA